LASAQSVEETMNSERPPIMNRRRPNMSAPRPPIIRKPPKLSP
jgi:hypothetical protein